MLGRIGRDADPCIVGPDTMKAPKHPLLPGEIVQDVWLANRTQHAQRAVGGRLFLTTQRLLFKPNAFDAALAGQPWAVPLADVDHAGVTGIDLSQFFGGGLRRRLAVVFTGGTEALFVVNGAARNAAAITAAAGGVGDDHHLA